MSDDEYEPEINPMLEGYTPLKVGDIRPQYWICRYYDGPWQVGVGLSGVKISSGNTGMELMGKIESELM